MENTKAEYARAVTKGKADILEGYRQTAWNLKNWFDAMMQEHFGGNDVIFKRNRKAGKLQMSGAGIITFEMDVVRRMDGKQYKGKGYEQVWDGRDWLVKEYYKESLDDIERNIVNAFKPVPATKGETV